MIDRPIPTDEDLDILAQLERHDPFEGHAPLVGNSMLPGPSGPSLQGTVIFTLEQWDDFCRRTATYTRGVRVLHPDIGDIVVYFRAPNGGVGAYLRQQSSTQIMVDLDLAFEPHAAVFNAGRAAER